jgi:hypothetical protein
MRSVPIELDRVRQIKIGIGVMLTLKKLLKKPLEKVDLSDIDEMLVVLTEGLRSDDKDITKEKVIELIDEYTDLETVITITTDAIMEAYGKNAKAAVEAAKKNNQLILMEQNQETEEEEEMEVKDFETLT